MPVTLILHSTVPTCLVLQPLSIGRVYNVIQSANRVVQALSGSRVRVRRGRYKPDQPSAAEQPDACGILRHLRYSLVTPYHCNSRSSLEFPAQSAAHASVGRGGEETSGCVPSSGDEYDLKRILLQTRSRLHNRQQSTQYSVVARDRDRAGLTRDEVLSAPSVMAGGARAEALASCGKDRIAGRTTMEIGASIFFTEYSISPTELAPALEERGFDSLWVAEHSHIPVTRRFSPPGTSGELGRHLRCDGPIRDAGRGCGRHQAAQTRNRRLPCDPARYDPDRQARRLARPG